MKVVLASRGDLRCLLPCVFSVLIQEGVDRLAIYMTGEFPAFGDFYLEQMLSLADIRGVRVEIIRAGKLPVRIVRDLMVTDNASEEFLWMIDDDVVLHPKSGEGILKMLEHSGKAAWKNIAAVTGLKADVNNRRGYPDFEIKELPLEAFEKGSYNCLYQMSPMEWFICNTLDTGNLVLNLKAVRNSGAVFQPFKVSANSSGEDTLFAMQLIEKGFLLMKTNCFLAYHLEKDSKPFSEFAARKEMLLRAQESLSIKDSNWQKEFMPAVETTTKQK